MTRTRHPFARLWSGYLRRHLWWILGAALLMAIEGSTLTISDVSFLNNASNGFATVAGGYTNHASGYAATVAGGWENTASGDRAAVPGGEGNVAGGQWSFAAGRRAKANHEGTFVWADSIDADFAGYTPPKLSQGWAVGYNVIVGWFVGLGIT